MGIRLTASASENTVTYTRNVFIPLTNLCRNACAYCGFRGSPDDGWWLMSPEEVMDLVRRGREAGCVEALITLGEMPEVYPQVRDRLQNFGFRSMTDYIVYLSRRILGEGLLPHINPGVLGRSQLAKLRRFSASMGLMLESIARLPAHEMSPGKHPSLRLRMMEDAGREGIPFTTGLLVGIGETRNDRLMSLLAIREIHERFGHIQEVIIQPFAPKPGTPMAENPPPPFPDVMEVVKMAREILPDVGVQIPPNLVDDVCTFLSAGANDLGGISSLTPDFINPEKPWPPIESLRERVKGAGFFPRERLPIYPRFTMDPKFMSCEVRRVVSELADEEGYRRI
ncbi:MAG: 7,8-didemethyl-8-hydroxy-5-deazariboflavin synthase subunit CofG [Candidatus Hadarchaeales archaeon]